MLCAVVMRWKCLVIQPSLCYSPVACRAEVFTWRKTASPPGLATGIPVARPGSRGGGLARLAARSTGKTARSHVNTFLTLLWIQYDQPAPPGSRWGGLFFSGSVQRAVISSYKHGLNKPFKMSSFTNLEYFIILVLKIKKASEKSLKYLSASFLTPWFQG